MKQNKMTLSFATKLHMLLILIVIAIGIYMFLLYKEVKIFQDELTAIKASLSFSLSSTSTRNQIHAPDFKGERVCHFQREELKKIGEDKNAEEEEVEVDEQENDESVSSQEIKEMLSAIQKEPEDGDEVEVEETQEKIVEINPIKPNKTEKKEKSKTLDISFPEGDEETTEAEADYSRMSSEELQQVKYEELRSFLKKKGQVLKGKGTKADLIKKIGELFCV